MASGIMEVMGPKLRIEFLNIDEEKHFFLEA